MALTCIFIFKLLKSQASSLEHFVVDFQMKLHFAVSENVA